MWVYPLRFRFSGKIPLSSRALILGLMAGDDSTGFICKACQTFFSHAEIQKWDTKWEVINGEDWLRELIAECPFCHETRSYEPNENRLPPHLKSPMLKLKPTQSSIVAIAPNGLGQFCDSGHLRDIIADPCSYFLEASLSQYYLLLQPSLSNRFSPVRMALWRTSSMGTAGRLRFN